MFSIQKKTDLMAVLTLLIPVWDFADFLKTEVETGRFLEEELEELFTIVSDAVTSVALVNREEVFAIMSQKISHMKHRETSIRNEEQNQAHILIETI